METSDSKIYYVDDINLVKDKIYSLYEKYYGARAEHKFKDRLPWYFSNKSYRLLLAEQNGNLLGQAGTYKVNCKVNGKIVDVFWSVDTFLLKESRGLGLGKKLQKKLHDDCPNFSSAWYSDINGIIKKKCGGRELFENTFGYYAVSKYYSFFFERVIKRLFKINVKFPNLLHNIYLRLNCIKDRGFCYREVDFNDEIINKIRIWMDEKYDFYVDRTPDFIDWKYKNNPDCKYHLLEVTKAGTVCGYLAFSKVYGMDFNGSITNISNLLDFVTSKDSDLVYKDALFIIASYFKGKVKLDGIRVLQDIEYKHKIIQKKKLLSTLDCSGFNNPYLSLIDQDMEQIL